MVSEMIQPPKPTDPVCVQKSEPETRRNPGCGEACLDTTQPIEDVYNASSTYQKDHALLEIIDTTDIKMPSRTVAHCASKPA